MYDTVRWVLLGLLFAGLFYAWWWSRKQAALNSPLGPNPGSSFKVLQKRWIDQRTGVCLVEAEEKTFLLAYTVGGGVSWQAIDKDAPEPEEPINRLANKSILPGNERK
jgi:hypothetical protein